MTRALGAVLLVGLASACSDEARGAEDSAVPRGTGELSAPRILILEVEPDAVRDLGWAPPGAPDGEAVAAAARAVERRLAAWGERGDVIADEDRGRLVVTPQAPYTDDEEAAALAALESLGLLEFLVLADDGRLAELGIDATKEREKLAAWREKNAGASLAAFDGLAPGAGGPDARIAWFERRSPGRAPEPAMVVLPTSPRECFGAGAFASVGLGADASGFPAISFELVRSRRNAFGDFTEANVNRPMAIVARGEILSAPRIEERLPGAGLVVGNWEHEDEVSALLAALKGMEGPLRGVDLGR